LNPDTPETLAGSRFQQVCPAVTRRVCPADGLRYTGRHYAVPGCFLPALPDVPVSRPCLSVAGTLIRDASAIRKSSPQFPEVRSRDDSWTSEFADPLPARQGETPWSGSVSLRQDHRHPHLGSAGRDPRTASGLPGRDPLSGSDSPRRAPQPGSGSTRRAPRPGSGSAGRAPRPGSGSARRDPLTASSST
jgi:hypothetical protein